MATPMNPLELRTLLSGFQSQWNISTLLYLSTGISKEKGNCIGHGIMMCKGDLPDEPIWKKDIYNCNSEVAFNSTK